jgi:hypothetical protein
MGNTRNAYNTFVEKTEGKDYLGDKGVDGRMILKRILKEYSLSMSIGYMWFIIMSGSCEHGNEHSGS